MTRNGNLRLFARAGLLACLPVATACSGVVEQPGDSVECGNVSSMSVAICDPLLNVYASSDRAQVVQALSLAHETCQWALDIGHNVCEKTGVIDSSELASEDGDEPDEPDEPEGSDGPDDRCDNRLEVLEGARECLAMVTASDFKKARKCYGKVAKRLDKCDPDEKGKGGGKGKGKDEPLPDSPLTDTLCTPQGPSTCESLRDCTPCDPLRIEALLTNKHRHENKLFREYKECVLDVDDTVAECKCDELLAQEETCTPLLDSAVAATDSLAQAEMLDAFEECLDDMFAVLNQCARGGRGRHDDKGRPFAVDL